MDEDQVPDTSVDIEGMPPTDEAIAKKLELLKLAEGVKQPLPSVLPPKDQSQVPMEPPSVPAVDIGKLSTAAPRQEFTPGEVSKATDIAIRSEKSGVPAEGMALLDTIATREAEPAFEKGKRAGWNTMVGGARFDPNTLEHPHKAYPNMTGFVGGAGRSYASGRYQETTATYYENVARSQKLHPGVEVRGWSEEAQNIRNWDKAQEVYRQYVKKNPSEGLSGDLLKDLTTHRNDPQTIGRMSRALSGEWTSAPGGREGSKITGGKEAYYGNTFIKMVQNAVAQAGGNREDIAEFMDPRVTAMQKPGLEKGGVETPGERAQVMALAQGTPIEQIKALAEQVRAAGPKGTASGQATVPAKRAATSRVSYTDMPQGIIPGTRGIREQSMPIPGIETPDFSMTTQATNPTVFSTIQAYQDMNKPPPPASEIKAPSDEVEKKSFIQNAMKYAGYLAPIATANPLSLSSAVVKAITDATTGNTPDVPDTEQIEGFGRGLAAGVASIPTNTYYGMKSFGQGAAGIFADQPEWQGYALENAQRMKGWQDYIKQATGIDPEKPMPGAAAGEFVGSNLSPNIVKTGINMLTGGAMEYLNPYIEKWAQSKPLGPLVPSAQAATVFGKPPIIVQTPGGPVVANDATVQGLVIGGLASLGFGLAISQSSRVVRYARENPFVGSDPIREGAPNSGVKLSSLPVDVLKAATMNPAQSIIDSLDRGKRYLSQATWYGKRSGLNKDAANEVYQTMRIQTRSGAENLAGQALVNGELKTDNFHFKVDTPIAKLHAFAEQNREFPEYLRARVIQDEIQANRIYNAGTPNAAGTKNIPPRIPRPETFTDHQNQNWNRNTAYATVSRMEQANPEFRKAYGEYQANLMETRRFSSDGPHAPENDLILGIRAMDNPSLPIFSAGQKTGNMFKAILNGDNPLRHVENNMKQAIMRSMSHDADQRYISFSRREVPDSFRPVDRDWIRKHGQIAEAQGAIIRRKENGDYKYWVGDPFVVSVLNNDSAAISTLGKTVVRAKRVFEHTTTGKLAPWFAPTALIRSVGQGFVTAPPISSTGRMGRPIAPAGPLSTAMGFAANVTPRLMNASVPTIRWFEDTLRGTPLGQMLDPRYHNLISRTFESAYLNSFYHRMKLAGAFGPDSMNFLSTDTAAHITRLKSQVDNPHVRAILDTIQYSDRLWAKFLRGAGGSVSHTWEGFNKGKEAFTEAGAFGWAYKAGGKYASAGAKRGNRLISDAELASLMRDYTGDPMIKGNPWSKTLEGMPQKLRFSGTPGQEARAKAYVGAGATAHGWRTITPWAGVLAQSPAATLAALRDNPVRANAALMASAVLPEIVAFMWNSANGQKALSYALDERGEQRNTHSIYLFDPRYPDQPWKGWEIPMAQEFILPRAMARSFAKQFMGMSSDTVKTELWDALKAFYFGGVQPPIPPPAAALLGLSGIATPEGYLNMRQQREHAFAGPGKENRIELMWRNIMPSIADISIAAYTAGWVSPSAPVEDFNPKTALKGAEYRAGTRVPFIGSPGRLPASSTKTDELFKYQRVIDDLGARFSKWDKDEGMIDPTKGRGTSAEGRARVKGFVGPQPPTESWSKGKIPLEGVVPPSNNPVYSMFMKEMVKVYTQDSPDKGGQGFKSLWKNHDIYKKKLDALNATHAGTEALYVEKMRTKMPKTRAYLESNGIDPYNFREVRDFYANRVIQAQKRILQTIQATEQKFDKDPRIRKLLKPDQEFKLELLDPNSNDLNLKE